MLPLFTQLNHNTHQTTKYTPLDTLENPVPHNTISSNIKQTNTIFLSNKTITFDTTLQSNKTSYINFNSQEFHIIGKANNLLVSPQAQNLALLGKSFNYISILPDCIEMGASVGSLQAFLFFKQHNLLGLEFIKNLPGNIGALCNMNAGMKQYEMSNILKSLNINGEWIDIQKAKLHYRGRDSQGIILAARFEKQTGFRHELLETFSQMRKTHPKDPSCGSCFKNPPNDFAGRLLEKAQMKGYSINGVAFSQKHANFLVNIGIKNGTKPSFEDACHLIKKAKEAVHNISGITLECEVQICK
ncbi:UDP-N-acetylenolpyruvoylglucosamine reductase [Helicobacter didelphidarum]|uniref:UDP-N-acetylenolpyruvoylglucosamine reductase n=2 Tax=Helicobacter didelphidarum TaxID=2040648 RepID=A0A3D8IRD7_9HELI|nr:UDP-N-acetylenolpyruvoylglucosamine reductase [Helicobacter didelphidarum]